MIEAGRVGMKAPRGVRAGPGGGAAAKPAGPWSGRFEGAGRGQVTCRLNAVAVARPRPAPPTRLRLKLFPGIAHLEKFSRCALSSGSRFAA